MQNLATIPLEDLLAEIRRRRDLIEDAMEAPQAWRPVVRAVARAFGVEEAALWREDRRLVTTYPRQAAMVLMRQILGMTYQAIGEVFRRDHGAVIHAMQTQSARMMEKKYRLAFRAAEAHFPLTKQDHAG